MLCFNDRPSSSTAPRTCLAGWKEHCGAETHSEYRNGSTISLFRRIGNEISYCAYFSTLFYYTLSCIYIRLYSSILNHIQLHKSAFVRQEQPHFQHAITEPDCPPYVAVSVYACRSDTTHIPPTNFSTKLFDHQEAGLLATI